jgi:hypothetical protein
MSVISPSPAPVIDNSRSKLPLSIQETIARAVAERILIYNDENFQYLGKYKGFGAFVNNKLIDIYIKSSLGQKDYNDDYVVSVVEKTALSILDNSIKNVFLQYTILLQCYINVNQSRESRREQGKLQKNIEHMMMTGIGNLNGPNVSLKYQ